MVAISLEGLRKVYPGGVEAVKGISLDIADGQMVVLVGPSGCGKSTLLRMVAGLETITDGALRIGDRRVNDLEPGQRDIAMVFQNYALYPHMTVRRNLSYGLQNHGFPKAEIVRRVDQAATMLEIADFLDRKPRQLSGGQRQRVAMGRAIVREPSVFLFDEPLSNLDAKLRVQMRVEIRKLQRKLGTTSLYVTHDQMEAMTLADLLVVMNQGRVEQAGSSIALYERPETRFVATFIGSPQMNILPGEITDGGIALGSRVRLPVSLATSHPRVWVGVRPEHLAVVPEHATAEEGLCLPLTVMTLEPVGAETLVHARLDGLDKETDVVLRIPGTHGSDVVGDHLMAQAPLHALHYFDYETDQRVDVAPRA